MITEEIRHVIHDAVAGLQDQGYTAIKFSDVTRTAFSMLEERGTPPVTFEQLRGLVEAELRELWEPDLVVAEPLTRKLPLSAADAERLLSAQQRCASRLADLGAEMRLHGLEG
jgi:hypothetical protein